RFGLDAINVGHDGTDTLIGLFDATDRAAAADSDATSLSIAHHRSGEDRGGRRSIARNMKGAANAIQIDQGRQPMDIAWTNQVTFEADAARLLNLGRKLPPALSRRCEPQTAFPGKAGYAVERQRTVKRHAIHQEPHQAG